ncbi:MAG: leucyl/phenylalanyl-tRNA---protein transferase [Methylobacteriaceae bacterium]|jgi:leucyl/phenylalanyl-tRNA--protein transferase|nr:leucyl/phenylalanyl-tRNA---protein transferase [Methylobacteriaceae bacterium]
MPSPLLCLARSTAPGAIRLAQLVRLFSEEEEHLSQEKALRPQRRAALFRESWPQSLRRQALAIAYALRPERIGDLPPMAALLVREALAPSAALPDPCAALAKPDGLCGVARDLSVATLVEGYASGLYPWCHARPVKWWAPRTRCVGDPRQILVGKPARRHARRGTFKFTFDRDFDAVIAACAGPRKGRVALTWITPKMMWAYAALHDAGLAHSYELWDEHGELVAGGYGVASGRVFVGESMFTRVSGAGAFGLAILHRHLAQWGFDLHDAKLPSPHLCSLGFTQMPREQYSPYLSRPLAASRPGHWHSVPALCGLP